MRPIASHKITDTTTVSDTQRIAFGERPCLGYDQSSPVRRAHSNGKATSMFRTLSLTLIALLACLAFGAASAQAADSISITVGGDPTEEVPLPITVAWTSALTSPRVMVTVKPSGGQTCGANYAADTPNSDDVIYRDDLGSSLGYARNWTFRDPGTFILCGYLQTTSSDTTPLKTTGPINVTVRQAKATVAINVPPRVDPGQVVQLSFPVTTELGRNLYVTVKPVGGRGCAATQSLDEPLSDQVLYDTEVQGTQTVQRNFTASQTKASYLLCAYIQEFGSDPSPEATASATFLVGPDPCIEANDKLRSAQRAVRIAETSVNNNRKSYTRYRNLAARRRGYARKVYRSLARRALSRYQSAVRRRANARATLATAQAGVSQACGAR